MGSDAISVGHLQAYGVIPSRSRGITFKHCEFCARGHKRRYRAIENCIGSECVLCRSSLACKGENESHAAHQRD